MVPLTALLVWGWGRPYIYRCLDTLHWVPKLAHLLMKLFSQLCIIYRVMKNHRGRKNFMTKLTKSSLLQKSL